ncbi:hypothetical protein BUALT_Bualt13G0089400 [Buddleja alternifolia]|uniref:Transposase n=1 Tax=Buddleja alternifolia TaxID=168488 RepID=A0AAV6WK25_9LAMI|nr:hypothetical protein BUALT_Bualt13G0089400 [Buddleja alternifolia]
MSQTMVFLHMLVAIIMECEQLGSRRQRECIVRYVMTHRISDQMKHMRRLTCFSDSNCVENLRMDRNAFGRLCYLVEYVGGLVDSRYVTVPKKRSGYTISVHFHAVLNAVLKLHRILLIKPQPIDDNCNNARWKPFKGCLGALDGSYIDVQVLKREKPRYRTRKGYYYLGDVGYMNCEGFFTPYRLVQYHLDEWAEGTQAPQNAKEYYNMMHSKARNVIERTWGCMKWRWAVLRGPAFNKIKIQNRIILACALLHNFIRKEMAVDPAEAEIPDLHQETAIGDEVEYIETVEASEMWTNWRDNLAESMFNNWRGVLCRNACIENQTNIMCNCICLDCCWTPREEEMLIEAVKGMIAHGWKADNGFRVGYLNHLADEMMKVFPGTDIRSSPHINSKMHIWKKHFGMVYALLGSSGIGWNETTKMLEGSDEHWEKSIKDDPSCKLLRHKPWPHYNHWLEIFGKDRANGGEDEDCGDAANAVNQEQTQTEHQDSPDFEGVNGYTPMLDEHEATSISVQLMCSQ